MLTASPCSPGGQSEPGSSRHCTCCAGSLHGPSSDPPRATVCATCLRFRAHCAHLLMPVAMPLTPMLLLRRRWDATPKVILIVGALQMAIMAYGFQSPNMSKVIGSEWHMQRGAASSVEFHTQRRTWGP